MVLPILLMLSFSTFFSPDKLARDQVTDLTHLVRLEGKGGAKTAKIFFPNGETAKIFIAKAKHTRNHQFFLAAAGSSLH